MDGLADIGAVVQHPVEEFLVDPVAMSGPHAPYRQLPRQFSAGANLDKAGEDPSDMGGIGLLDDQLAVLHFITQRGNNVQTIIREAQTAAKRLQRRLDLPACDREDLAQDLLIDLLRRLPAYNPERGSLGAFSGLILRNQSSRIAFRVMRERRAQGGGTLSLDAPFGGDDPRPLIETIATDQGLDAWHGRPTTAVENIERHNSIQSVFGHLPDNDRRLCVAVSKSSVTALAANGFGSRSALYRRLAELRAVLTAHGLGPAWDEFATA